MTMAVRISACGRALATAPAGCAWPSGTSGGAAEVRRPAAKIVRLVALLSSTRPNRKRSTLRASIR